MRTIILALGLLAAGCAMPERLAPSENGVWLGVKNMPYEKVWNAANTVMARRFEVTEADAEMGTIVGKRHKYTFAPTDAVAFFIWPTENNDAGYSVDLSGHVGSVWEKRPTDWKKVIIDDLKKALGAS